MKIHLTVVLWWCQTHDFSFSFLYVLLNKRELGLLIGAFFKFWRNCLTSCLWLILYLLYKLQGEYLMLNLSSVFMTCLCFVEFVWLITFLQYLLTYNNVQFQHIRLNGQSCFFNHWFISYICQIWHRIPWKHQGISKFWFPGLEKVNS